MSVGVRECVGTWVCECVSLGVCGYVGVGVILDAVDCMSTVASGGGGWTDRNDEPAVALRAGFRNTNLPRCEASGRPMTKISQYTITCKNHSVDNYSVEKIILLLIILKK